MNFPILYLDSLILLATINPASFSFSLASVLGGKRKANPDKGGNNFSLMLVSLSFILLLPLIPIFKAELYFLTKPQSIFYLISVVLVPVCIFLEYYASILYFYLIKGKVFKGITLHSDWKGSRRFLPLFLTGFIAMAEEFIFRQCWFLILEKTFLMPMFLIIVLTSVIYGLNHIHFGFSTVISKCVSGGVYGILYVVSGYSIILPIVTHVLQNYVLILFFGRNDA